MSLGFHSSTHQQHTPPVKSFIEFQRMPSRANAANVAPSNEEEEAVGEYGVDRIFTYTAICASGLLVSTFVVLSSLRVDIWNADVWGRAKNSTYCEPPQPHSVQEPINSWSNVIYIAVGAYALVDVGPVHSIRHAKQVLFFFNIAVVLFLLGGSSFLFHASFARVWRDADKLFTRAVPIALCGYSVFQFTSGWAATLVLACTLVFEGLALNFRSVPVFGVTLTTLILVELVMKPVLKRTTFASWGISVCSILLFFIGYAFRELEVSGRLCLFSAWFQPHSVWHVLTGIACGLQLRVWKRTSKCALPPDPSLIVIQPRLDLPTRRSFGRAAR